MAVTSAGGLAGDLAAESWGRPIRVAAFFTEWSPLQVSRARKAVIRFVVLGGFAIGVAIAAALPGGPRAIWPVVAVCTGAAGAITMLFTPKSQVPHNLILALGDDQLCILVVRAGLTSGWRVERTLGVWALRDVESHSMDDEITLRVRQPEGTQLVLRPKWLSREAIEVMTVLQRA